MNSILVFHRSFWALEKEKRPESLDIPGAEGRGRTGTAVKPSVFETDASANSATSATSHFDIIALLRNFVKVLKRFFDSYKM